MEGSACEHAEAPPYTIHLCMIPRNGGHHWIILHHDKVYLPFAVHVAELVLYYLISSHMIVLHDVSLDLVLANASCNGRRCCGCGCKAAVVAAADRIDTYIYGY